MILGMLGCRAIWVKTCWVPFRGSYIPSTYIVFSLNSLLGAYKATGALTQTIIFWGLKRVAARSILPKM